MAESKLASYIVQLNFENSSYSYNVSSVVLMYSVC